MKILDKDIATIEAMYNMLLEHKVFGLDSKLLTKAKELTAKMYQELIPSMVENTSSIARPVSSIYKEKDFGEAIEKFYDKDGNASHYDKNRLNSLVKFERTYGTEAVMAFCEITADRYRERIGKKDNQSLEQELMKINWYEKAAKYFFNKINEGDYVIINNKVKYNLPWNE